MDKVFVAKCPKCIFANCGKPKNRFITSLSASELQMVFPKKTFNVEFEDCTKFMTVDEYYRQNCKPVECKMTFTVSDITEKNMFESLKTKGARHERSI